MPQPDLRCYHHPEREATSQCDRCGDYLCDRCVTYFREQYLCATCIKDLTRAILGRTGRIACVIVFASFVVGWVAPMAFATLLTPAQRSWTALIYCLFAISILSSLAALILSLMGRKAEQEAARKLRAAVAVYSAVGVGGVDKYSALMTLVRISGLNIPTSMVVEVITSCLLLVVSVFACVLLLQAFRRGIKPLWPVILFAVPVLLAVVQSLFSVYGFASILLKRFV